MPAFPPRTYSLLAIVQNLYNSCPGCPNSGSCCCAPRNPVTRTVHAATKTVTVQKKVTKTVTATYGARSLGLGTFVSEARQAGQTSELVARHLCPVCPSGVAVLSFSDSRNNGGSSVVYCCPPRKTVTKTLKNTSTKRVTKTSTIVVTPASIPQGGAAAAGPADPTSSWGHPRIVL